eukprot:6907072-Pyramimonas_sp.AAC.1
MGRSCLAWPQGAACPERVQAVSWEGARPGPGGPPPRVVQRLVHVAPLPAPGLMRVRLRRAGFHRALCALSGRGPVRPRSAGPPAARRSCG